jgi:rSAM/selenodomain-associated transferase 1
LDTLLIMIRNPELGKVKSRLAATVGAVEALRIYQILLARTRVAALSISVRRLLFYSDFVDDQDIWFSRLFEKHVQQGDDLGARMQHAFQTAFQNGAAKAVIIGSDCPALTGEVLYKAFDALDQCDFVVGPVPDGGYYLLGMKQLEPALFGGIAWSTDTVRSATLAKIKALHKTYTLLPELSDIDTAADWEQWLQH